MPTGYYKKTTKKDFERRLVKGIKICLREKETKRKVKLMKDIKIFLKKKKKCQYHRECHQNLSEDEKQRIAEHRSYHITPIK